MILSRITPAKLARKTLAFCLLLLCVAIATLALDGDTANAQGPGGDKDYVDVELTLEWFNELGKYYQPATDRYLDIIVMNHGSRTAYDVEVVVDIVYPTNTVSIERPSVVPIGGVSMEGTPPAGSSGASNGDGYSLRWTIPALPGLARKSLRVEGRVRDFDLTEIPNVELFDERQSPLEFFGEVTTSSFDLHQGNNTDRLWVKVIDSAGRNTRADGGYSIDSASVDEHHPSPGDIINFTFTATTAIAGGSIDTRVAVELTDGLSIDEDPNASPPREVSHTLLSASGATPLSPSYSNGVFTTGRRKFDNTFGKFSATLPIRVASTAVVNEQCITVTITGTPPPGTGPFNDDISDNVAKLCLGIPSEKRAYESGTVGAWTIHACKSDVPANGCDTVDEVDVQLVASTDDKGVVDLTPAVIHVKDVPGRVFDSHTQSVTGGTIVSWQTASPEVSAFTGTRSGVQIGFDRRLVNDYITNWTNYSLTFVASDLNGSAPPGKLAIRSVFNGNELWTSTASAPWTFTRTNPFPLSSQSTVVATFMFEFEKLGTYVLDTTLDLTHASLQDAEDNARVFSRTSTTYFHVGPIADLSVADGGASPHVASNRNAMTIVVANNRVDESPGSSQVTGLPTGAEVIHVSHGTYDGSAGVWNVGELKVRGYYRSRGEPEPTLVLEASAGDTATAKVVFDPYLVCIGSDGSTLAHTTQAACEEVTGASWHEGTVYDYNAGDNTATITAVRGTGGIGPGVPSGSRTTTGITAVTWDPVQYLYGLPVVRYEVQRLDGSSWTTLDDEVTGNVYVDTAPSGGRDYQVRAVNSAGATGPWSRSTAQVQAGKAGPPLNLRTQADGNNAIDVSWDAPEDTGGSAVTGYTVQWSTDGTGGWSNAGSTADQTFKHRGLQSRRRSGTTGWRHGTAAAWACGRTRCMGQIGVRRAGCAHPEGQVALRLRDRIDVERTEGQRGSHNGLPDRLVLRRVGEQLERAVRCERRLDILRRLHAVCQRAAPLPRKGGERRGQRGHGRRSVSAITQLSPPAAPNLTGAEADGPNAIVVTWEEPSFLGDLSVTQYQVQWAKDPDSQIWRGPQTLSGSTLSWRHTGLKPAETWHYQVRASNGGGRWSGWSYILAATTASDNAPKAVSGLSVQFDKDSYQVNVTWNEQTGGDTAFSYDLQRSEDGSDWRDLTTVSTCDAGKCAYADRDIWRGAKLYYRVRASIDGDAGPWSSAKSVTVPPDPPDEPHIMWAEANGSDQIYYEWEPPYYDGGAPVTGYRLLWCRVLDGADDNPCDVTPDEDNPLADPPGYSRTALGASVRSYTQSVSPGYVYYYLLRATNGGNRWSEWGYVYSVTVYPGLPAAPGLTARAVDANQIKVTWTRPSSPGSEIGEYWLYIYRYGEDLYDFSDNIIDILRIPGDQTEYTLGGLDPETTRYFRVRALNDNGEGKYSVLRQATTPASTQSQTQARNDAVLPNSRPQPQERGRPLPGAAGHNARGPRRRGAWRL